VWGGLFVWTGTRFDYFICELYSLCLLYLKIKETSLMSLQLRLSFFLRTQMKILLIKSVSFLFLHWQLLNYHFESIWIERFSPNILIRLDCFMMNRLNLGFYSHINIHQHTHQLWKRKFKHVRLMCENQWGSFSCYAARLSFSKKFVLAHQAGAFDLLFQRLN